MTTTKIRIQGVELKLMDSHRWIITSGIKDRGRRKAIEDMVNAVHNAPLVNIKPEIDVRLSYLRIANIEEYFAVLVTERYNGEILSVSETPSVEDFEGDFRE